MLRYAVRWLVWLLRRAIPGRRPPDYVAFRLHGAYRDYPHPTNLLLRRFRPPRPTLLELTEQLHSIAQDHEVRGLLLDLGDLQLAQSQVDTLRATLEEVRAAGKRVVAWSYGYSRGSYRLATAADEILLIPGGSLAALGPAAGYPFLADALARVGVEADFLAVTPYKSAADAFVRREMSNEMREMTNWLMDGVFAAQLEAIAAGRHVSDGRARELVDETPCTDLRALELGLIDGLATQEDLPARLGHDGRHALIESWEHAASSVRPRPRRRGRHVGLIAIEGMIVHGESARPIPALPLPVPLVRQGRAGDVTVVDAARRALRDPHVGAVVVYVNSPGGSPTASESIRSALHALAARKPVVFALGPVAASGGYYVATASRPVFAQAGTLTGSIGVVGGKLVLGGLLGKLGVNVDLLHRGRHALLASTTRGFSEEERAIVSAGIARAYDLFLERVGEGREMARHDLEPHAGGRVWTGQQALDRGLVDELGGLDRAIARARTLAGLPDDASVRVVQPSRPGRQPPIEAEAAALGMGMLDVLALLAGGRPLYLCPLLFDVDA